MQTHKDAATVCEALQQRKHSTETVALAIVGYLVDELFQLSQTANIEMRHAFPLNNFSTFVEGLR